MSAGFVLINHVGDRFGMLVVVERASNMNGKTRWLCKCDCGGETIAAATNLRTGNTKSCGCTNSNAKFRGVDLAGRRFAFLTVIERKGNRPAWICKCDCGSLLSVSTHRLFSGQMSCGCNNRGRTMHGLSHTTEYRIWKHMIARCEYEGDAAFRNYGGRGICVCERWHSFENFYSDMGQKPSPKHSIDRIDNDGPYSPENCRWVTAITQANNTRRNRIVIIDGESMTVAQASRKFGVNQSAALARLYGGWSDEAAFKIPVRATKARSK